MTSAPTTPKPKLEQTTPGKLCGLLCILQISTMGLFIKDLQPLTNYFLGTIWHSISTILSSKKARPGQKPLGIKMKPTGQRWQTKEPHLVGSAWTTLLQKMDVSGLYQNPIKKSFHTNQSLKASMFRCVRRMSITRESLARFQLVLVIFTMEALCIMVDLI